MNLEICKDEKNIGIKLSDRVLTLVSNKIIEIKPVKCEKISIEIKEKEAVYKGIKIPLYFPSIELNLLRLLYIIKGEVAHDIFYYKNSVEIHIDSKLKDMRLMDESKVTFTRFCGNYGLLFPNYCIGNETFAIFSKNKNDVISAYREFKEFLEYIRKILLNLGIS
ncbi:hypothetical protein SJAV_07210 [Sulfurisphaera javensis]|uniref:Uncharacterized protein n=1 Tax=Sulfurisphaera javensis TaxID=2049879 RepID=A0AAT9GPG1_9CREN